MKRMVIAAASLFFLFATATPGISSIVLALSVQEFINSETIPSKTTVGTHRNPFT